MWCPTWCRDMFEDVTGHCFWRIRGNRLRCTVCIFMCHAYQRLFQKPNRGNLLCRYRQWHPSSQNQTGGLKRSLLRCGSCYPCICLWSDPEDWSVVGMFSWLSPTRVIWVPMDDPPSSIVDICVWEWCRIRCWNIISRIVIVSSADEAFLRRV